MTAPMTATRTAATITTALALTLAAGCEKKQAQAAAQQQAQIRATEGTATAQKRWPEFLEAFSKATDHSSFKVKATIQGNANQTGEAWVNVQSVVGTSVAGPLLADAAGHKKGDRVTVTADKVKDWAYTANGKTVGDFTAPPVDPNAPAADSKAKK
ncbi:MAG TPA: DUF2314 domain-containing protein [Phycisphaerales bacterium]|nr:DUF2314 domain-containing protein [Phycisphaerales bacterium]